MKKPCRFCNKEYEFKNKQSTSHHLRMCNAYKLYKDQVLTKKYLTNEYLTNERSAIDIANEHGFNSSSCIMGLLKKYNIKTRNISTANLTEFSKNKTENTNIKKYGSKNVLGKKSSVRTKMELNVLQKYSVENVFQIPEVVEQIRIKSLETKYERGLAIRPELLTDWELYHKSVSKITRKIYKQFISKINPNNLKRARNEYQLDHMVSVKFGFENNIPADIISHCANLQMLSEYDNISKGPNCSIAIEELYKRIHQYEYCEDNENT